MSAAPSNFEYGEILPSTTGPAGTLSRMKLVAAAGAGTRVAPLPAPGGPPVAQDVVDAEEIRWRGRGLALTQSVRATFTPLHAHRPRESRRRPQLEALLKRITAGEYGAAARGLLDDIRYLQAAERESRAFLGGNYRLPGVVTADGHCRSRVGLIAATYLAQSDWRFDERWFSAFIEGFQDVAPLDIAEVWSLRSALQLELTDAVVAGDWEAWPEIVGGMRAILDNDWEELFESLSLVDRALARDPSGLYQEMTAETRDLYRQTVGRVARYSQCSEIEVAECAVRLATAAAGERRAGRHDASRARAKGLDELPANARRAHVGYFLLDQGLPRLKAEVGYRAPIRERLAATVLARPDHLYLGAILAFAVVGVVATLRAFPGSSWWLAALVALPAAQIAIEFANCLFTSLLPPRVLPKLDFSAGIPRDCATLVAVPALLLNEPQVRDLVHDLEIRCLANPDPNLYFALLTDSPDSDRPVDDRDKLAGLCATLIEELNGRCNRGRKPFLLLHRRREYCASERRWMGWERKRGKLIALNRLLRGAGDAFPLKVGDITVLRCVRYVITLDADTKLPREAAHRLVGTMAHPLNRAVVDPVSRTVTQGYGILQPRVGVSIRSASRSRLATLFSGRAGFDIYTRAVSDVYQDLFGEGIFTGKGIYDVDAFRDTLEDRFPDSALLSHDLLEGIYARAGLVSDIEVVDEYPSHFSAWCRRRHRWMRGDWQIAGWLAGRVPDRFGRRIANRISAISRWKIADNLRRTLIEPSLLALLLAAWLWLPASAAARWTLFVLAVPLLPELAGGILAAIRAPGHYRALPSYARSIGKRLWTATLLAGATSILLLHQATLALDAIARSLVRVFWTHRRLLEWETAAEAESRGRRRSAADVYLQWTPCLAAAIGVLVWRVNPASFTIALPIVALWMAAPWFTRWLDLPARRRAFVPDANDHKLLRQSAASIWRFFDDWGGDDAQGLIPDSVGENGSVDKRVSPTNIGMLLNARIAALHLGLLSLPNFARQTRRSLDSVLRLEKVAGQLFNWYDLDSLRPLAPRFVSTADSGNLAAALLTLKQAALSLSTSRAAAESGAGGELRAIAEDCDALVAQMDFSLVYSPRRQALAIGFDAEAGERSAGCYDLLASESRIATFIAIAKGDIPQKAWMRLGRARTRVGRWRIMRSWTGTMFEYLMPTLWMRHDPHTIAHQSAVGAARAQREFGRRHGIPWGISESACFEVADWKHGYRPFGLPLLAMKRISTELVVSPYSSFLALGVDAAGALDNLEEMADLGWFGEFGFFESVDYRGGRALPIRRWMAHHQGMSLLAIANLCCQDVLKRYFHSEPLVAATEMLLDERPPEAEVPEEAPVGEEKARAAGWFRLPAMKYWRSEYEAEM
jgi:cyclic beta-1,2-glucan synthetase